MSVILLKPLCVKHTTKARIQASPYQNSVVKFDRIFKYVNQHLLHLTYRTQINTYGGKMCSYLVKCCSQKALKGVNLTSVFGICGLTGLHRLCTSHIPVCISELEQSITVYGPFQDYFQTETTTHCTEPMAHYDVIGRQTSLSTLIELKSCRLSIGPKIIYFSARCVTLKFSYKRLNL